MAKIVLRLLSTIFSSTFFFQTHIGLLWLLYDLANNPKAQDTVYEEVTSLIGPHGDFTPVSFAKLDYLKACVKETMR